MIYFYFSNERFSKHMPSKIIAMKKLLITLIAILICGASYAQFFMLGPRVGFSSSQTKINETINDIRYNTGEATAGFHAGLFSRITVGSIYLQPEVLFTNSGGEIELASKLGKQIRRYEYNKLDIPVMLGYKLSKNFRIQAGPVASYLLKADAKEGLGDAYRDVKDNYEDSTIGYQLGIGFDIWRILLDLKYEGNLSKFGSKIGGFNTDLRNNQVLVSVGFRL